MDQYWQYSLTEIQKRRVVATYVVIGQLLQIGKKFTFGGDIHLIFTMIRTMR